jgi:penicillin-binding protein 1B
LRGAVVTAIHMQGEAYDWVELPPEHITSFRRSLRERRVPVQYADLPPDLITAVLAAEDRRFFEHRGIDSRGIGRALVENIKQRRIVQGGSTITQQVVKQILGRTQRTVRAKIDEAIIALAIDKNFAKETILQVYLNEMYLGQEGPFRIHGVAEGARFHFGKPLGKLAFQERLELAASIRAPNAVSPRRNPQRLLAYVDAIDNALELVTPPGDKTTAPIDASAELDPETSTPEQRRQWRHARLAQLPEYLRGVAASQERIDYGAAQLGYFIDALEREWKVARKKYRVRAPATLVASIDPVLQLRAAKALERGLADAEERTPRESEAPLQGAIVVLDPQAGAIRALIGGNDYLESPFNRALDAKRPVGSIFKPVVYLAALGGYDGEAQISQSTWLPDEARSYKVGRKLWKPANFDGQYRGWVTARQALSRSVNAPTVALGMDIGVKQVAELAEDLGLRDHMPRNPSILLGAVDAAPLRVAGTYAALANGGRRANPHALVSIWQHDRIVPLASEGSWPVLDPRVCFIATDMLISAMQTGTGRTASRYGFEHLAAGKTGTTDDMRDSWFVGYTPEQVCAVWIGFDDYSPTGLTGARAALPVWARFMRSWNGVGAGIDFKVPPGVTFERVDSQTGGLAHRTCPSIELVAFLEEARPQKGCSAHNPTTAERDADRQWRQEVPDDPWSDQNRRSGFWARVKDALGV